MRVMISQPMNGRSENDIRLQREGTIKKLEKLGIEVVDSVFKEEPQNYKEPALYYLAKSIDLMGRVNAVYFMEGWQHARGCIIERKICEYYDIKILDKDFLEPNNMCGPQIKRI